MAQDEYNLKDAEKGEEVGSNIQGAVFEDPAKPNPMPVHESSSTSSAHSLEETPAVEEDARDLEELAAVSTGPVYSAFSMWKKRYVVIMVTWAAFISPTSANIYFPALNPLRVDLGVSTTLINLTLTSYMIFQGLAPTIFGDLADMAGRRPAYILAFTIYLGANIGLALQNSYAALFILRCMQSTGSSGAIALGYGVVADISPSSERGKYMGDSGSRNNDGTCLRTSYRWHFGTVPGMAFHFLVSRHSRWSFLGAIYPHCPRNWPKSGRQWLHPSSGLEHDSARVAPPSQGRKVRKWPLTD